MGSDGLGGELGINTFFGARPPTERPCWGRFFGWEHPTTDGFGFWAGNVPCLATVMVSHHWRNLFGHLVAAVIGYALGETSYEATAQQLKEKSFEDLRQSARQLGRIF